MIHKIFMHWQRGLKFIYFLDEWVKECVNDRIGYIPQSENVCIRNCRCVGKFVALV